MNDAGDEGVDEHEDTGSEQRRDPTDPEETVVAADRLLQSLRAYGVEYVFANLGTDHTPLLEAAARLRAADAGDSYPTVLSCPHEFVAMSAAHGYAAATGDPQAVLVHVDVGTQNLGAAMHNAHRAAVPVFVISGLAPITETGYPGSRDHAVHYAQDVFDQPGIVREYCRWTSEYQSPADPATYVRRGLERANAAHPGPVYLTASREALELPVTPSASLSRGPRRTTPSGADRATVETLAERVAAAERPVVVTTDFGTEPSEERVETLVAFAEAAGAGVVEHGPTALNFPRNHPLHVGYEPTELFDDADLLLLVDVDVPWVPANGRPNEGTEVVQIDPDPTKATYPHWSYDVDLTVGADARRTLDAVTALLDPTDGEEGRTHWERVHERAAAQRADELAAAREADGISPVELSAAVGDAIDSETVLVEGAVTSRTSVLDHVERTKPGSYVARGGAGLGWAGGASVGIKLARPDSRVVSLVGDGSYLFSNPVAHAWLAAEYDAPTLTVVYNNARWNAVRSATAAQHPDGDAVADGVPESEFGTPLDLSVPARAAGLHTQRVEEEAELADALAEAVDAVDGGKPAVVDVRIR
ncbi:acetolactate synthase-1/2/3 large subunit [Halogranum gelatinilyticum]|uniref:Acetolactate synthase-1/2/3 large subunit n=1 Tax=Halogranum gelatinilyticum TaxID=660521 RepID=A0A1H0ADR5_9EURY|nr:thiamine pyrophosphate-requiring protein [Halogranum gelatinilyticum]SDN30856.1 acetolactate synthase-1/2/3 large subunit [Halogranum gelatinilyticum]